MLAIQETKIDDSFPQGQFAVPQYKMFRKDYKSNEGGLMRFVRNDLPQFRRHDLESHHMNNNNGRIEILAIEVLIRKDKWISIYKQPKVKTCHVIETVDKIMLQLAQFDLNIVLLGDFNINMLRKNEFSDCLDINGLVNIVKEETCFKGVPSMFDLIITNKSKRFTSTICVDTGLSDYHFLVCTATKIQLSTLAPIIFKYRSYKHFNNDLFLEGLSKIPYHVTEIFDDVNDSYWLWHQLTMQVVNEHAPLKTGKVRRQRAPYMNGKLRRAINVKNMLKRKFEKVGNKENWNNYRLQRNIVTKLRKNSINVYLAKKCNVNTANNFNGYGFWETIKPLISKNWGCEK